MPTFTTPTYTAQAEARANPSRLAPANVASGEVEFAVVPYTIAGTEVAADIINIMLIPKDAIPVPQLCRATVEGSPGTALTMKIGTTNDDDGLATAVALTSAARDLSFCNAGATQPAWVTPTPIVADSGSGNARVFATLTTATAPAAASRVNFLIAYKRGR